MKTIKNKTNFKYSLFLILSLILLSSCETKMSSATPSSSTEEYDASLNARFDFSISNIKMLSDGSSLKVGSFTQSNINVTNRVLRLISDLSFDKNFDTFIGTNGAVSVSEIYGDQILIGGTFTTYNNQNANRFARINSDGTLDSSFDMSQGANAGVSAIAVQTDGKILVGGSFTAFKGVTATRLVRLNTDGTVDNSFDTTVGADDQIFNIQVLSNNKILIAGRFANYDGNPSSGLALLNSDGTQDLSFNIGTGTNSVVKSVAILSDGKILIGGAFTTFDGNPANRLVKLNSNGSIDSSFDTSVGANSNVEFIKVLSSNKILIGGGFTSFNGSSANYLAKLNSDGTLDSSFDMSVGASNSILGGYELSNGKLLIVGNFISFNGVAANRIVLLNSNGSVDTSFPTTIGFNSNADSVKIDENGKLIIIGNFTTYGGVVSRRVVNTKRDGTTNLNFDTSNGSLNLIRSVDTQSDGKIIIGGDFIAYGGVTANRVARLNTDGSLDTSFNTSIGANGFVSAVKVLSSGKILIGGVFTTYNGSAANRVALLNTDGSLDVSFDTSTGADGTVFAITQQSDGKIILGGSFLNYNGSAALRLVRLNLDGSIDNTFDTSTGASSNVESLALQSDGKILIAGGFLTYKGSAASYFARINSDGSLDTSFDTSVGASSKVIGIAIQTDGKILIGGSFTSWNGAAANRLARLNTDGSLDTTFDMSVGAGGAVNAIAIQSDGKILVGGLFLTLNNVNLNRVARLNTDGTVDSTY